MNARRSDQPQVTPEETAADWFGLKRSGQMDAEQARAFDAWLAAEPEHRAAYDNLEHYWELAGATRNDPEVLSMREAARRTYRRRWAAAITGAAMAASVVVGVFVTRPEPPSQFAVPERPTVIAELGNRAFETAVGQSTTVLLPDGSAVTLDTDSRIRTRMDGRRRFVELEKGRAFFKVAKDRSRPFVVAAAGRTITALGTAFEVRADPKRFEVTLVEGRVRVEGPLAPAVADKPQATELTPGSQLVARDEMVWSVARTDVAKETSWLRGRIAFDNDPLSEVVAEMNRYSDKKIVIADPEVARTPILGVFKAGDTDGLVKALESYGLAKVTRESGEQIDLGRI